MIDNIVCIIYYIISHSFKYPKHPKASRSHKTSGCWSCACFFCFCSFSTASTYQWSLNEIIYHDSIRSYIARCNRVPVGVWQTIGFLSAGHFGKVSNLGNCVVCFVVDQSFEERHVQMELFGQSINLGDPGAQSKLEDAGFARAW